MRLKPIAATTVVLAAVATGILALAVPGGAQQPGPPVGTMELVQRNADVTFRFVDEAPRQTPRRAFSPGDTLVSRGPLRTSEGRSVGHAEILFVVTRAKGQAADTQVSATIVLGDGHIVMEGADTAKQDVDTFAIIGGTGRYAGARGTIRLTPGEEDSRFLISFMG